MSESKYHPPGWLQAWLEHIPQGPALDLGAGAGELATWLAERGYPVTAVERDPAALSALRGRSRKADVEIIEVDLTEYQPPPSHFSLIVASSVLHFIDPRDLASLAQRLIESLVPGGFLMAEVFTVDDPGFSDRKGRLEECRPNTFKLEDQFELIHYFDKGELRSLFTELQVLYYQEDRRLDSTSEHGYHGGATLVARRANR